MQALHPTLVAQESSGRSQRDQAGNLGTLFVFEIGVDLVYAALPGGGAHAPATITSSRCSTLMQRIVQAQHPLPVCLRDCCLREFYPTPTPCGALSCNVPYTCKLTYTDIPIHSSAAIRATRSDDQGRLPFTSTEDISTGGFAAPIAHNTP